MGADTPGSQQRAGERGRQERFVAVPKNLQRYTQRLSARSWDALCLAVFTNIDIFYLFLVVQEYLLLAYLVGRELPSVGLPPIFPQLLGLDQAEATSRAFNVSFLHDWQRPNQKSQQLCVPGYTFRRSQGQLRTRTLQYGRGHLNNRARHLSLNSMTFHKQNTPMGPAPSSRNHRSCVSFLARSH